MKEKLIKLKELITGSKKSVIISISIAVLVVAVIVASIFALGAKDDEKTNKKENGNNISIEGNIDSGDKEKGEESSDKTTDSDKDETESENEEGSEKNEESVSESGESKEETTSKDNIGNSNGGQSNNNASGNIGNNSVSSGNDGSYNNNSGSNNTGSNNNVNNYYNGNNNVNSNTGSSNNTNNNTNNNTGNRPNNNTGNTGGQQGSISGDVVVGNAEQIYNQLFDINSKVTIKLDISDSELKKLQADFNRYGGKDGKSPIYRRANMIITINNTTHTIKDVGVRMKGNSSRCNFYNNGNVNDRNLVHLNVSFDETFDEVEYYGNEALKWNEADRKVRKKRTFATLNGLELKWNRNFDGTYITNWYTNQMFRAYGVYAQNTNLCNLNFGGYNYGVYTVYEPVDGNFLERYLGNDCDGDLYKCAWGQLNNGNGSWSGASYTTGTLSSIGKEPDNKSLVYDIKTNKNKTNHSSLKKLINTLASCSSSSTFGSVVDTDNWVKFAAVSYFVGNPDDMRNNYNNHYVYFKGNGKAIFIPYDNDRTLGITVEDNFPMYDVSPYSNQAKLQRSDQINPLYKLSVTRSGTGYCMEAYKAKINEIASSKWMNYSNYQKYYNIARNNYSSVAIPDSNVKAFVRSSNKDKSKLAFSENYTYEHNVTVKTYMSKIKEAYKKN